MELLQRVSELNKRIEAHNARMHRLMGEKAMLEKRLGELCEKYMKLTGETVSIADLPALYEREKAKYTEQVEHMQRILDCLDAGDVESAKELLGDITVVETPVENGADFAKDDTDGVTAADVLHNALESGKADAVNESGAKDFERSNAGMFGSDFGFVGDMGFDDSDGFEDDSDSGDVVDTMSGDVAGVSGGMSLGDMFSDAGFAGFNGGNGVMEPKKEVESVGGVSSGFEQGASINFADILNGRI